MVSYLQKYKLRISNFMKHYYIILLNIAFPLYATKDVLPTLAWGSLKGSSSQSSLEKNSWQNRLLKAAQEQEIFEIISCINEGADVNICDQEGNTILNIIIKEYSNYRIKYNLISFLIRHNANITLANKNNQTPADICENKINLYAQRNDKELYRIYSKIRSLL